MAILGGRKARNEADDEPVEDLDLEVDPDEDTPDEPDETDPAGEEERPAASGSGVGNLVRAAHVRTGVVVALGLGGAALLAGREPREAAVITGTALVGQFILGWHNDLIDVERDAENGTPRKPIAEGRLDPGTVWFTMMIAALLLIPLAATTGIVAGAFYLGSLLVGMFGNLAFRNGRLSFLTWAVQFGCYPAYLSFGGWGGQDIGDPPQLAMVGFSALLGVGLHFLISTWGLVADDADGWSTIPLRLARRFGTTFVMVFALVLIVGAGVGIAVVGTSMGLRA